MTVCFAASGITLPGVVAGALLLALNALGAPALWIEGEAATRSNVVQNTWYTDVPKSAFSGGAFLSHFHDTQPGAAAYDFTAAAAGRYEFWLRLNPHDARLAWRLNDGAWTPVVTSNAVQAFTLAGWDMRFLGWVHAGAVELRTGANTLEFRFDSPTKNHAMLDCFVLTQEPFEPFGLAHPGEAAARRAAAKADATNWFDFAPPALARESVLNLRELNERFAGEHGRIQARDGRFVHATTGAPVRFWAVNGPPHDLSGEALRSAARTLAAYGVNLVRAHGAVFDSKTGELDPQRVAHLAEVVAAMKAEGIYTHLSIYFPLWFNPQPGLPWLEGYDGNKHPFAALMFNAGFQQKYEAWWRAIMAAKLPDGTPLSREPALFGVELQNEDSFFFWTFNDSNLPDPQLRLLETQFGTWLEKKYGSLAAAFTAWGEVRLERDSAAEGRAAFRPLWEIFSRKTPRDRDTAAFLFATQAGFYQRAIGLLRGLGFEGLITCSNWATASPEVFGPIERLSYLPGDFIDRHGYLGCRNGGLFSEWSIRDGHTWVDRSALRFDAEEPGRPRQFNHPVMDIEYNGKPSMISETTWNRPNRYRGEAPLFFAAYGALQGSDAIVHFAFDGAAWSVKPNFFMQPWTLMAPTQMGQFPAAARIFRQGLVAAGDVLADLTLSTNEVLALQGTPLPQDAAFDELRLKDVPAGAAVKPGQRIDPLIHLAGRTRVNFAAAGAPAKLADLAPLIDRAHGRVRSSTGELELDYQAGLLKLNAPAAQGASGNLQAAGEIRLRDLTLRAPLETGHVIVVPLDGKPLASSGRMLLQVMTEEQPTGWKAIPQGGLNLIESIGRDPWRVRQPAGTVRLTRPDAAQLQVTALDLAGQPAAPHGRADAIALAPATIYYLIEAGR